MNSQISLAGSKTSPLYDLVVVGGGINGAGLAADAAGRGLSVLLCEQDDLASATSSASTKLIHGGLRYLEHYEFRLVREALKEREVLLKKAPHLVKPMRFILPYRAHLRPVWMIRLGLFLYDKLDFRGQLPGSGSITINPLAEDNPLSKDITRGFIYSDCFVDDARLVIANAIAAREQKARIYTRTRCTRARRNGDVWDIELKNQQTGATLYCRAKALVNAAGPWAQTFLKTEVSALSPRNIRLIKGSHIAVPTMYRHPHAYTLQNEDGRVVFVIPYHKDFTLIGTTDKEYQGDPSAVTMDQEEETYLLEVASKYFKKQLAPRDIIWRYSGVRPLCDDDSPDVSAITRDYTLELETPNNGKAPLLSIFGGKITTYRKLAEAALLKLAPHFPNMGEPWTRNTPLPGGDTAGETINDFKNGIMKRYPWLPTDQSERLVNCYGTRCTRILDTAQSQGELGENFGHGLYTAEVDYLIDQEWARTVDDIVWRRTKLGLYFSDSQLQELKTYIEGRLAPPPAPNTPGYPTQLTKPDGGQARTNETRTE